MTDIISTKEAEQMASAIDHSFSPNSLRSGALRSLAADRDALQAKLDAIVIPTTYYMDPPDGGDVSIAEQVIRMYRHVCDLQAENARLRAALEGIEEYWNGAAESAVDAAEECRDRARAALGDKE